MEGGEGQENSLKHPKISKAFIKSSTNSDRKFRDKNTVGIIFYYRITAQFSNNFVVLIHINLEL